MLHILPRLVSIVSEQMRDVFPEVNDLVSTVKIFFLKEPSHVQVWK